MLRKHFIHPMPAKKVKGLQVVEVMALSLITSTVIFYLPAFFAKTCKEVGRVHSAAIHAQAKEPDIQHLFFCQPGETNEIATLLLGSRNDAIKRILRDPTSFDRVNLLTLGVVFFLLMILTFGVSLPSGIFTPTVISGSSLGGVAGMLFQQWINPDISPSTFALLGIAALLAGVQRTTVSICIILVEATGKGSGTKVYRLRHASN